MKTSVLKGQSKVRESAQKALAQLRSDLKRIGKANRDFRTHCPCPTEGGHARWTAVESAVIVKRDYR